MKRFALLIILISNVMAICAQTPQKNLEKYWNYRERLREQFIVISQNVEDEGVNIPAGDLYNNEITWSDGNSIMSHYLSLLSTELYLLKNNGYDYSTTLKELYYAMLAMERLDLYSESHWRKFKGKLNGTPYQNMQTIEQMGINPVSSSYTPTKADINGMHLRDDVTPAFWNKNKAFFGVKYYSSNYNTNDGSDPHKYPLEEISQDVMYHNIEGLSLVARLVGTENVANIPVTFKMNIIPQYLAEKGIKNGNSVNFSLWAKDIVKRYITYFQSCEPEVIETIDIPATNKEFVLKNDWVLRNSVTGDFVKQGSSRVDDFPDAWLFYNYGLIAAGKEIVGEDLREDDNFTVKVSEKAFKSILTNGMNQSLKDVIKDGIRNSVMEILCPGSSNKWINAVQIALTGGAYVFPKKTAEIVAGLVWTCLDNKIDFDDLVDGALSGNNDDYKVRSLACTGLVLGGDTYKTLVNRRSYDPNDCGESLIYEHFPLMCLVLHDRENCKYMKYGNSDYASEKALYENLLNSAPLCGPSANCKLTANYYSHNWSETSRCVWPENLRPGKYRKCDEIEFSGLDYMMLYNLYCIAFSREQYKLKVTDGSVNVMLDMGHIESSKPVTGNHKHHYATSITYLPGFSVSGERDFEAKAISVPNNMVNGGQYRPLNVDCGCTNKGTVALTNSRSIRKAMSGNESYDEEESEDWEGQESLCYEELDVQITPNPSSSIVEIKVANCINYPIRIDIMSIKGVVVQSFEMNEPVQTLDVSQWTQGIYVVRVVADGTLVSTKMMVTH